MRFGTIEFPDFSYRKARQRKYDRLLNMINSSKTCFSPMSWPYLFGHSSIFLGICYDLTLKLKGSVSLPSLIVSQILWQKKSISKHEGGGTQEWCMRKLDLKRKFFLLDNCLARACEVL